MEDITYSHKTKVSTSWKLLLFVSFLFSCWDAFTTFIGVSGIMNNAFIALVFTAVINGLLYAAHPILKNDLGLLGLILKGGFLIALICDLYTSFIGNKLFAGSNASNDEAAAFIILCLTLMTSISPLVVSYTVFEKNLLDNFDW